MKEIILNSRVIFTLRGNGQAKEYTFEKGTPYSVSDSVASNSFILSRLISSTPIVSDSEAVGAEVTETAPSEHKAQTDKPAPAKRGRKPKAK